jgi:hypothetical protein
MEVFGKEINLDLELTEKQQKLVTVLGILLLTVAISYPMIVKPSLKLKAKKEELAVTEQKKNVARADMQKEKGRYESLLAEYQRQKDRLEILETKFKNSSLQDNASLKNMVQEILDHLKIKVIEIGAPELAEDESGYVKIYTPYKISGDANMVAKFFYFLENSNYLITLRGSALEMKQAQNTDANDVEVKFKVGSYFIDEGGDMDFE